MSNKRKWPIETAYYDFLKRMGLKESELYKETVHHLRCAFFAGAGTMFRKLNSEGEGVKASPFTIDANIEINSFFDKNDIYTK